MVIINHKIIQTKKNVPISLFKKKIVEFFVVSSINLTYCLFLTLNVLLKFWFFIFVFWFARYVKRNKQNWENLFLFLFLVWLYGYIFSTILCSIVLSLMWNVWRPKLCGIADLFDLTKHTQTKPLHKTNRYTRIRDLYANHDQWWYLGRKQCENDSAIPHPPRPSQLLLYKCIPYHLPHFPSRSHFATILIQTWNSFYDLNNKIKNQNFQSSSFFDTIR